MYQLIRLPVTVYLVASNLRSINVDHVAYTSQKQPLQCSRSSSSSVFESWFMLGYYFRSWNAAAIW